jgi:hydroxymethylpyrimidine pyrophosphatase-like HAD family hydrolase
VHHRHGGAFLGRGQGCFEAQHAAAQHHHALPAVDRLSEHLGVPHDAIAAIGDGQNDTLMFAKVGLSIAMGNCDPEVQHAADVMTARNDDEGFARAVDDFLLS